MRALKTILFHTLHTFRGLFLWLTKAIGTIFLIVFFVTLFFGQVTWGLKLLFLALGIGFSAMAWYYDMLILKLKPENVDLTLMQ